jgi:hypothetical protein
MAGDSATLQAAQQAILRKVSALSPPSPRQVAAPARNAGSLSQITLATVRVRPDTAVTRMIYDDCPDEYINDPSQNKHLWWPAAWRTRCDE